MPARYLLFFRIALVLCLAALLGTRLAGLERGAVDFVPGGDETPGTAFYHFHPDERTVINTALRPYDPFGPAPTAYGPLNFYLLRAALGVAGLAGWGTEGLETAESSLQIYRVTRLLAAVCSLASVALVYAIGRGMLPPLFAAAAALTFALLPLSLQQAHFYTPDAPFTLAVLAFFWALAAALRHGGLRNYVVCGICIGLAAATRLNGALLGLLVFTALALPGSGGRDGPLPARLFGALRRPPLWIAAAAAVLVLAALQPNLLIDPLQSGSSEFSQAVRFARGQILTPWSLVDVHTTPYLHYWSALLPQAAGWPLTLLFGAAWLSACWRPAPLTLLAALWCLLAFGVTGGLHTKHVRYLMPLLPFFCLLGADLAHRVWRRGGAWTWLRWAPLACALYGAAYGTAQASVYWREDGRIRAARWIEANLPAGSAVGRERGGFAMGALVSDTRYRLEESGLPRLFYTGPYMLCGMRHEILRQYFRRQEYFVALDVNRYRQFTAVPEIFPAVAATYSALFAGRLGFVEIARFETPVAWGPWRWDRADDEPAYAGYDRPTVRVFRRTSPQAVDRAFAVAKAQTRSACADGQLQQIANLLGNGSSGEAAQLAEQTAALYPYDRLALLLGSEARLRTGDRDGAAALLEKAQPIAEGPLAHMANPAMTYLIPWAAGSSLIDLGLEDLAIRTLVQGGKGGPDNSALRHDLALNYMLLAQRLIRRERAAAAESVLLAAIRLSPTVGAFNALASLALGRDDPSEAAEAWYTSLQISPAQNDIYPRLVLLFDRFDASALIKRIQNERPEIAARLEALRP